MIGTVIVDVVLGVIAAYLSWATVQLFGRAARARARLAGMATTRTSSVAEVSTSGAVALAGVAVPLDSSSLLEAPLSGTPCLWWRVAIDEVNGSSTQNLATKVEARDFYLDDGSGAVARVRTDQAKVELPTRSADPAHAAAARRLLAKLGIDKPVESLLWFEERIDPRADVHVRGRATPADASLAAAGGGPFRPPGHARERLVVGAGDGGELVVSVGHEAALAAKTETDRRDSSRIAKPFAVLALGFWAAFLYVLRDMLTAP